MSNVSNVSDDIITFSESIHTNDLNCVVCFEPLVNKKIMLCPTGSHNMCLQCVKKLVGPVKCPIDRSEGSFIPDLRREKLVKSLTVNCIHSFCKVSTFPWLMKDHVNECCFQSLKCPECKLDLCNGVITTDLILAFVDHFAHHCNTKWICVTSDRVSLNGKDTIVVNEMRRHLMICKAMKGKCRASIGTLYTIQAYSYNHNESVKISPKSSFKLSIGDAGEMNIPQSSVYMEEETKSQVVFVPKSIECRTLGYTLHDIVDARDTQNKWLEAQIIQINHEAELVLIKYLNWSDKWNEWLPFVCERLAPHRTHTKGPNVGSQNLNS